MLLEGYKVLNNRFEFDNLWIDYEHNILDMGKSEKNIFNGYVIPGLIDVHTHGVVGQDSMHIKDFDAYSNFMYAKGITTFYPTTISAPISALKEAVCQFKNLDAVSGLNLEGPFLNAVFCGAHRPEYICEACLESLYTLQDASGGKVKLITVAPEIGQNMEFIAKAAQLGVHVSLGHSACDYETALAAVEAGADHITHLFNAMSPLHHRKSGLPGAAFDRQVYTEIIGDGIHISPEVVRLSYRAIGEDRLLLISDSMMATGLADGMYTLGDMDVKVKDGIAYTNDGALAGSTSTLYDMVRSVHAMGIPIEKAIKMASYTPAKSVGEKDIGILEPGKRADFVILDKDWSVLQTVRNGQIVYSVY